MVQETKAPLKVLNKPTRTSDPTFEPVTLEQAKYQVSVAESVSVHDDALLQLISFAREDVETDTGIIACTGTFQWNRDQWWSHRSDNPIVLPFQNVSGVSSIRYRDQEGNWQLWDPSNYRLDVLRVWPVVWRSADAWPEIDTYYKPSIEITFEAGYVTQDQCPVWMKQATLARLANLWVTRGMGDDPGDEGIYRSIIRRQLGGYGL